MIGDTNKYYIRETYIDGIGPWVWLKGDTGAWDGPTDDWETSHKTRYFEDVKAYRLVIQAGGNLGLYPRLLSERFDVVYTFEPDSNNFTALNMNCNFDNIIRINGALGEKSGTFCSLTRPTNENVGMHRITSHFGHIPIFSIDSFDFPYLDLLCLDIEHHEKYALYGAKNTIERCKPVIVVENMNEDILVFLEQFGYNKFVQSKMDIVCSVS